MFPQPIRHVADQLGRSFVACDSEQDQIAHHLDMAHEDVLVGLEHGSAEVILRRHRRVERGVVVGVVRQVMYRRRCAQPARSVYSRAMRSSPSRVPGRDPQPEWHCTEIASIGR